MPKGIPRNKSVQQAVLHRLKITRGHLGKVISMVEGGDYCIDIIHQSLAIQAALRETNHVILKNHMETCVADAVRRGQPDEVISEVMSVIEKSNR